MTCNVFFVILGTLSEALYINASLCYVFRDLASWLNSITSLVSSDELATDVSRAEALLERHQVIGYHISMDCFIFNFTGTAC